MAAKELSDNYSLVTVASGAKSLRSLEHGETFHPVVGPAIEARALHVAQSRIIERARRESGPFIVWDIGLGAAANALAIIETCSAVQGIVIELHSFDITLNALYFAISHASDLVYPIAHISLLETLLRDACATVGNITWHFHQGDFRENVRNPPAPPPHAILYDPYSPVANPGMWDLAHLTRLYRALDAQRPCTLTSYSRSTAVRVTLALAGFCIGRGPATGQKSETTIAANSATLLEAPLGEDWLLRVARSTRGAPLRAGVPPGPISEEDFGALRHRMQSAA